MAKKGGQQQLQADIQNDEEYEKFLERKGLLVMDVYTEWCGPCLAMVGSLKKIKLELGGDNLQLAICKSDNIEALSRFRNKSEPTWLFASHGRIVNIMFGTNVPKLMKLIAKELEIETAYSENTTERKFFEKDELLPIEEERLNIILTAEREAQRIEQEESEQKRREYLTYITNEIQTNLPECGVTIFGPHVNRDIFKKISEAADSLGLSSRDRRVAQVLPEHIEVLHFDCKNPLNEDTLEYIFNKDLLICLWKLETSDSTVEEVLGTLTENITKSQIVLDEFGAPDPDANIPPMIQSLEVEPIVRKISVAKLLEDLRIDKNEEVENKPDEDHVIGAIEVSSDEPPANQEERGDSASKGEENSEDEVKSTEQIKSTSDVQIADDNFKIVIPAVWTPGDKVTNAAAIYLFFRPQTEAFLPPDPVPEPPHLAIAFEAYKRKDVLEVCEQYKDAILTYGYFDNATPDKAKLIANSTKKYETKPQTVQDKLVLKVAKVTSHAILSLSVQGPTHVSQNTVIGKNECLQFFPEGYKTGEVEELESAMQVNLSPKKKKKKKRKSDSGDMGTAISDQDVTDDVGEGDGGDDDLGTIVEDPDAGEGDGDDAIDGEEVQ